MLRLTSTRNRKGKVVVLHRFHSRRCRHLRKSQIACNRCHGKLKLKCDVPRDDLPWEMQFIVVCVTPPIKFVIFVFQEKQKIVPFSGVDVELKVSCQYLIEYRGHITLSQSRSLWYRKLIYNSLLMLKFVQIGNVWPNFYQHIEDKTKDEINLFPRISPLDLVSNRSNTRKSVSSDFETRRSRLEKRGAAEFFFLTTSRCLEIGGNTLSSV